MSGEFKRDLSIEFIEELKKLALKGGWLKEILKNRADFIIALRGDYLNIYHNGQSLFKVEYKNKKVSVSTNPKYLLNPDISGQVFFDGNNFDLADYDAKHKEEKILISCYKEQNTLEKLKRSANKYSGIEKTGVHDICRVNKNIIDVEITLTKISDGDSPKKTAKRLDIAQFIEIDNQINLCFWEEKEYRNPELWSIGKKSNHINGEEKDVQVISQVKEYRCLVETYRTSLRKSYELVAKNLVEIAKMSGHERTVDSLIERVAAGEDFIVSPKNIGIVLFGFSQFEKDSQKQEKLLRNMKEQKIPFVGAGKPRDIKLNFSNGKI